MDDYKGYKIEKHPSYSMVEIKQRGSGNVPASLEGMFQTETLAHKAINSHLASLVGRGKSNGKKHSNSTS